MLGVYTWLVFVSAVLFTGFGLFAYTKNKTDLSNQLFGLLSLGFALWGFSWFGMLVIGENQLFALFFARLLNLGATLIPVFYLHWVLVVLDIHKRRKIILIISYIFTLFFALFSFSDFYITGVQKTFFFPFWPIAGFLHPIFLIFGYIGIVGYAIWELLKCFRNTSGEKKYQIKYILLGSLLGFGGGMTNFPPMYGIQIIPPIGIFLVAPSPLILGYAAIKYHLFNLKLIITELFAILISSIFFLNVLTSNTKFERATSITLLFFVISFSMLLVRSVLRDAETRERIEGLVKDLARANEHLRQMEQQKSEFVSIASHQLRTPLTAIKGYASMILEGSFGALNEQARDAVEKLFKSSQRLVGLVEDFLTVSRIERGKMQFDFTSVDLKELIGGVVKDLEFDAKDKGPVLTFQIENGSSYVVRGDALKLKQVFTNVIDNAIKFTNRGFIRVLLSRNNETKKMRIAVSDTGAGMDFNTILHLFKRFDEELTSDRGKNVGMSPGGLGLYVSHQIVKAHSGNIWAQSEGVGKGSTFFIELPERGNEVG